MREFLGLPIGASAHAPEIDAMIVIIHWLMIVLFIGWGVFFGYTLVRFRRTRNPKADPSGVRSHASSYLEVGVAVFEGVLLVVFAFPLWAQRVNQLPPEGDATVVRIVAEQFAWNVHYPGPDGIFGKTDIHLVSGDNPLGLDRSDPYAKDDITTINQLNLPLGKPVIIRLSSKDVIHSFNLPLFRVKQDAIPGEQIKVWFVPTMTTAEIRKQLARKFSIVGGVFPVELGDLTSLADYKDTSGSVLVGQGGSFSAENVAQLAQAGIKEVFAAPDTPTEIACAQLCGLGHYRMRGFVTIQTPEEYQQWLKSQAPTPDSSQALANVSR
jgi:cytochrome c oxidase subunit 2